MRLQVDVVSTEQAWLEEQHREDSSEAFRPHC